MLELVWNDADGHYELIDQDEFLMAIAKDDIKTLLNLLANTPEGQS